MTRPGRPVESDAARQSETLHGRLDAIAELHSPTVGNLCAACLLPHPCPTAAIVLGRGTDTRGGSVT